MPAGAAPFDAPFLRHIAWLLLSRVNAVAGEAADAVVVMTCVGRRVLREPGGLSRRASSARTVATVALEPKVQEGDGYGTSGFPLMADMHTSTLFVPWVGD